MCDTEHMLECSSDSGNSNSLSNMHISNPDFDQIVEEFQVTKTASQINYQTNLTNQNHKSISFSLKKNLNSKKIPNSVIKHIYIMLIRHFFQEENPFFQGEKLPIAAKKGIHVID